MERLEEITLPEHLEKLRKEDKESCRDRMNALGGKIGDVEKLLTVELTWIKKHIDSDKEALEKRLGSDKEALDKRLGSMNEFREALRDTNNLMFTRAEHEAYQKAIEADLRVLRESRSELAGARKEMQAKASQSSVTQNYIIAVVGLIVSLVALAKEFWK